MPSLPLLLRDAADAELRLDPPVRRQIGQQSRVWSGLYQTQSEGWSRNSENHVIGRELLGEIRLRQDTSLSVGPACDGVQAMHSAIRRAVGVLTNRASRTGPSLVIKEGTVFCAPSRVGECDLRIRSRAAAAHRRDAHDTGHSCCR